MDKVLVIIVTYNAHDWIHQCLSSVDMDRYDAFVVDNASTDDTLSILHAEYPKAIVRAMDKNLGFGQANNIGLRYALDNGYDYVFLLNQDAWLLPDTIEKLIIAQKQHPEYGVLSPLQMNTAQGGVEKQFGVYCKKNKVQLNLDVPQPVDFVNAALWLISIECIRLVGGFNPIYPHYGEDVDFVQRIQYKHRNVGVVANVIAYHERVMGEESLKKMQYRTKLSLMGILLDINHPFVVAFLLLFFVGVRKIIKGIILGDKVLVNNMLRAIVAILSDVDAVLQYRKISRSIGAYL